MLDLATASSAMLALLAVCLCISCIICFQFFCLRNELHHRATHHYGLHTPSPAPRGSSGTRPETVDLVTMAFPLPSFHGVRAVLPCSRRPDWIAPAACQTKGQAKMTTTAPHFKDISEDEADLNTNPFEGIPALKGFHLSGSEWRCLGQGHTGSRPHRHWSFGSMRADSRARMGGGL